MKKICLLLSFSVLMISCSKLDDLTDIDGVAGSSEFAIPLINTSISLADLLRNFEQNSSLTIDPDGTLRFNYSGDVITQNSGFMFDAIQHTLSQFPVIPVLTQRMALPFSSPDGLELDRIDCKSGTVAYYVANPHPDVMEVTVSFPDVKKNGVPLTFNVTLPPYSGTGDMPFATNFFFPTSVTGYTIASNTDSIFIEYQAIRPNGANDTLHNVLVSIQNLQFTYAEGYLGNYTHQGGRDTILIDFFDNWTRGDVYFDDPTVTFNIENSFGIPTKSVVNVFNIITADGRVLPLESPYVTNGIDFPYPSINEVGQVKSRRFVFNKHNSNIDVILGAQPVAVDYDVNALTNPDNDQGIRGFITDESFYRVRVEVELPLHGRASGFAALDTFDINLGDLNNIDFAEFKLFTDNELPLDISLQAFFLNDQGMVIDSMFSQQQLVVKGAPVNSLGISNGRSTQSSSAIFEAQRFSRIKEARKIAVQAAFSTINNGNSSIKVLANQDIRIKLGAKLGRFR